MSNLERGIHTVIQFGRYSDRGPLHAGSEPAHPPHRRAMARQRPRPTWRSFRLRPHRVVITIEEAHKFLEPGMGSPATLRTHRPRTAQVQRHPADGGSARLPRSTGKCFRRSARRSAACWMMRRTWKRFWPERAAPGACAACWPAWIPVSRLSSSATRCRCRWSSARAPTTRPSGRASATAPRLEVRPGQEGPRCVVGLSALCPPGRCPAANIRVGWSVLPGVPVKRGLGR